jgi:hypothetical protein
VVAAIAVNYGALPTLKTSYRVVKHAVYQFCIGAGTDGPAYYHSVETINDWQEENLSRWYLKFTQISYPFLVGCVRMEITLKKIGNRLADLSHIGAVPSFSFTLNDKMLLAVDFA